MLGFPMVSLNGGSEYVSTSVALRNTDFYFKVIYRLSKEEAIGYVAKDIYIYILI